MVPEWQEAYMDYEFLKTFLKEIQLFKQRNKPAQAKPTGLSRSHTLYRAFSGLTQKTNLSQQTSSDVENQVILVNNVRRDGGERSETMFLMAADEGGEYELVYFKRLDDEFNKVVRFYKLKAEEVIEEAGVLNKQMEALIAFRVKVENPKGWVNRLEESNQLASDVAASRAALFATTPSLARTSRRVPMDVIDEEISINRGRLDESGDDNREDMEIKTVDLKIEEYEQNDEMMAIRPAPLDILERVKFNTSQETPRSTIKGFLNLPNQTDLKFSKDNLRKAEEQLKKAFVEFYHKLRLLKSFSFLNIMAFSKIMKKYDKIASRNTLKSYMKMVDNSYLGSSDEVSKLMERVEVTFIKHFSNSNRSKGMNILRPKKKKERHRVTFSMGFLVGCTIALILALALIIRARNILDNAGRVLYMETMFPLYRRYRVNYSFIFGFKQGTELGYREILLLGFCLSVLALASVLANLDMEMDPITQDYKAITELLPLGLVVVTLPDFFLADQLTSQVQALRSLEFYICYYGWGDYKLRENSCQTNDVFNTFSYVVAVIPYSWRLLQKDGMQGYNGLKYLLTILAVCSRTAYSLNREASWKLTAWIFSVIATILSTYWDIVIDWGLFQRNSKNRWLRDKLLIPHKTVYFIAMVLNVLLRLAWMQTVMGITIFSLHRQTMVTIVASLEIIRRGLWNFFRLENEHLNNVGKYRAFKSVPLPFNYDEDEDKDE
ncbi:hypothetical protein DH2020_003290 [Rehmannia glutinosa]|uniref:Phosphate transporter PHO1-like protein n=1 Tax=Rehmannia glutinosa TaxID=99300 RepID=A0ABR0XLC8_REHGL